MAAAAPAPSLPALREDLQLLAGPPEPDGAPTWTLFDPIRNRFFRITWTAFQLLSRWSIAKPAELLDRVRAETTCEVNAQDLGAVVRFLYANSLTRDSATGRSDAYLKQYAASRAHWLTWLVHNYLFFRVPLFRPQRFLKQTLPWVEFFFRRRTWQVIVAIGVLGLYLASRQWEVFTSTFLYFFSLEGAALYGVTLFFTKLFHELGHAYTATRYGCRVPTMGLAFVVTFPMFYTDVTDSWRLVSRHQRVAIGAAGIIAEMGLALLATFLWSFLPDGPLRSAAFLTATVSWITTLTINISPFMRLDGYYLLSDWWGIHNLQERAFALGRWLLRELLFGLGAALPESINKRTRTGMITYAWATWLYRLIIWTGLSLLVYYFFFKLLGLTLFIVEIAWFIVLPIARELMAWWQMRKAVAKTRRTAITLALLGAAILVCLIPWNSRVRFPAILQSAEYATVFTPEAGRIAEVRVRPGQSVKMNEVLLRLDSPELQNETEVTEKKRLFFQLHVERTASNPDDLADMHVSLQQLASQSSKLSGLLKRQQNLVLRAPMSGRVTDVADSLQVGRWIDRKLSVAFIVNPQAAQVEGLVTETELGRLAVGQTAWFYPDDAGIAPVQSEVVNIQDADVKVLDVPYLASAHGGDIAVRANEKKELVPESAVYRVRLATRGDQASPGKVLRGVVHVRGQARSLARRAYDVVAAVLIRESGF